MPTEGPPITLGTVDLTSLCGCPDPCPDCCITSCGCTGLPTTLHATCTNDTDCNGVADDITLTYDIIDGKWKSGSVNFGCGDSVSITFYCVGSDCTGYRLDVTMPCSAISPQTGLTPLACACDPFEVEFAAPVFHGGGCSCCTTATAAAFFVTITK